LVIIFFTNNDFVCIVSKKDVNYQKN
jgi:hypothetical protein